MKIPFILLTVLLTPAFGLVFFNLALGMFVATVSAISIGIMLLIGLFGFWVVDREKQKNIGPCTIPIWTARVLLLAGLIAPPANGFKSFILFTLYFAFVHWYRSRQRLVTDIAAKWQLSLPNK